MAYWLLKTEPEAYSYDDLARDGVTVWDGVANNAALIHLRAMAPDAILHGGDIGHAQVIDDLAALAPLIAIRGNIDDHALAVPDAITLRFERVPNETVFSLLLIHIAVAGPQLRPEIVALAQKEGAALVVCGHSHVPFVGRDREITIFNPGSIGPRRLHLPIVFGEIVVDESVTFRHLDAETGETWLPPPPRWG